MTEAVSGRTTVDSSGRSARDDQAIFTEAKKSVNRALAEQVGISDEQIDRLIRIVIQNKPKTYPIDIAKITNQIIGNMEISGAYDIQLYEEEKPLIRDKFLDDLEERFIPESNINDGLKSYLQRTSGTLTADEADRIRKIEKEMIAQGADIRPGELLKLAKEPAFTALMQETSANFLDASPDVKYTLQDILMTLLDLNQTMQELAAALAGTLKTGTERLNAYTTLMTQVPVWSLDDYKAPDGTSTTDKLNMLGNINAKFANMLEAVRAHKGLEEDKAKKIQTLLQSTKDFSSKISDFFGAFVDLLRGISSTINRGS